MFKNKNLLVVSIIAVVNALGYGIIIPLIYPYSQKFGLTDFQNGLLFSVFSLAQFIATPIIGRLSDKYGRKPVLFFSLLGTALSFLMMAFAKTGTILFVARALDGITAGNIPVVSAVISDTTVPKDRAKGFAIIGASFGFGFVFGPAISSFTVGLGIQVPFLIATAVTTVAVFLTMFVLAETNTHEKEVAHGKLFDFKRIATALTDPAVGTTLALSLLYSFAFGLYIYAFQPFAVKALGMTEQMIAITFTAVGLVGLIAQLFVIPQLLKRMSEQRLLVSSLAVMALMFLTMFFLNDAIKFIAAAMIFAFANSFVAPIIQTFLSKETDVKSQGSIMGLNASYVSIGTIFGPILGGALATLSVHVPFLAAALFIVGCIFLSYKIMVKHHTKLHAFG
jgi:MFS family permease